MVLRVQRQSVAPAFVAERVVRDRLHRLDIDGRDTPLRILHDDIEHALAIGWRADDADVLAMTTAAGGLLSFLNGRWREAWTRLHDARNGQVLHDFGVLLPRRPNFSPDGRWLVAGPTLLRLDTLASRTLDAAIAVSQFLPDGRIVAATGVGAIAFYCPSSP